MSLITFPTFVSHNILEQIFNTSERFRNEVDECLRQSAELNLPIQLDGKEPDTHKENKRIAAALMQHTGYLKHDNDLRVIYDDRMNGQTRVKLPLTKAQIKFLCNALPNCYLLSQYLLIPRTVSLSAGEQKIYFYHLGILLRNWQGNSDLYFV